MPLPHGKGVVAEFLGPAGGLDDLLEPIGGGDHLPGQGVALVRDDVQDLEAHQGASMVSAVTTSDSGTASSVRPQRSRTSA
ncbi:hypothetical protein ACFFX0_14015 [Citricoccus parietis]|uniref:Uncharacterized protein n=1 Tax=Citricoccus parietis TaxID=592307 RepID=A0ABV5FZZ2_9MICC